MPLIQYLMFLSFLSVCSGIRLRAFGIPAFAVSGGSAVLECDYDLEGLELYSLKWYKNGMEFYR